jgi:hypothetical protein
MEIRNGYFLSGPDHGASGLHLRASSYFTRCVESLLALPRKPFRYCADFLFLFSCAAYALNRFLIKPHTHITFIRDYFNDMLLVPCALPALLFVYRRFGLRHHDRPPTPWELTILLIFWSIFFEIIGPFWLHKGVSDKWDVVAYAVGGIAAWLWWNRKVFLKKHRRKKLVEL